MTFRNASLATATLFLSLSITLVFLPELVYWLFSLTQNDLGDFLAKRAGALFLGLCVLCFYGHNSSNPEVIRLISLSIIFSMGAMSVVGIYELARGYAGSGILIAIAIELILCAIFLHFWMRHRK